MKKLAKKQKAARVAPAASEKHYDKTQHTAIALLSQCHDPRKAAARCIGTLLRESRTMAAAINARCAIRNLQRPIVRLRSVLDSLTALVDRFGRSQ